MMGWGGSTNCEKKMLQAHAKCAKHIKAVAWATATDWFSKQGMAGASDPPATPSLALSSAMQSIQAKN
jgi:hypothetical protein